MRAGKLDTTIDIGDSKWSTASGKGVEEWTSHVQPRAQVLQRSVSDERQPEIGRYPETETTFRIRYTDAVSIGHKVRMNGATFEVREIKHIGRRRAMELRCTRLGG